MSVPDPVTPATLVDSYRRWSNDYLKQQLEEFTTQEAYNRKRREAIETVLDERKATA